MKVKATAIGFDNLVIRNEGDVFELPDGSKGAWFEPVLDKQAQQQDKQKAQQQGKQTSAPVSKPAGSVLTDDMADYMA